MRNKKMAALFLLPSILGVSVFVLIPFLDVMRRSFVTAVTGEFAGFSNYRALAANTAFRLAVKNTLRFTAVCMPLLIGSSLAAAALLSRQERIQKIKMACLFPMAVPAATVVLVWKLLFYKSGLINGLLQRFGMEAVDFMGSKAAFWVLVLSYIWKNFGYTLVLWLGGILNLPEDMLEAARVDGAGEWKCFFLVVLPNLKPTFYTITILSFLNSFKVFREAYLVAGGYPHESMYLLQHLFNNWFVKMGFDKMAAAAVVLAFVLFAVSFGLWKLWDGGMEE